MANYPYPELSAHTVDALGVQTSYYQMGRPDGQPVLLLHGMTTTADSFRETMHELGSEFWLIAPDMPGFGYSEDTEPYNFPHLVEWLAGFREALDLPPTHLLGHSFGGALAAAFAITYPEDVSRLILSAPAIFDHAHIPDAVKRVGLSLGLLKVGTAVTQSKPLVYRQIKVPFHDVDKQHESVWERRLNDYEQARASAHVLRAVGMADLWHQVEQIRHPTCLIWGEEDQMVPISNALELEARLPEATLYRLLHCGHVPMLEHQAAFQQIVRAFFGRNPSANGTGKQAELCE